MSDVQAAAERLAVVADKPAHLLRWGEGDRNDLRTLLSALQEAREALVPDGWALVPIEPTEAMISAGANGTRNGARETAARTYASMLSAAEVYRALSPGGTEQ